MSAIGLVAAAVAGAALALALARADPLPRTAHPEREALRWVAPGWSIARWEAVRALVSLVAGGLAVASGVWPLALAGPVLPTLALRWRSTRLRDAAAERALDVLRATGAALRSGVPVASAVRLAIADVDALARAPFERALRAFDLRAPLDDALRAARADLPDRRVGVALDALALVAAEDLPTVRAAGIVLAAADRLAFEARLIDEMRARTSGTRVQIVILALLVPAIAAYLVLTMPGLARTLASPLGTFVLIPVAALLEVAGIVASRAIVRELG